ncbi:hypothetical protein [Streptomyces sviceus]|uniref:hypothetical protein n=1 Tax=Streptomyces sviceus TaxID=285530 RepID=UPI0033176D8F
MSWSVRLGTETVPGPGDADLPASVLLFALSAWDRQPLPLLVITGVTLPTVLAGGGVCFPRARHLPPAFPLPLLLPVALHPTRATRRHRTLALTAAVPGSAYWGACMALLRADPP